MLSTLVTLAQDQPDTGQVGWIVGLGAAGTVVGILAGLVLLARAVRTWVRDQAAQVAATAKQVETTNGRTLGQLAESTATKVDELSGMARDNRTLIVDVQRRLDEHMVRGHGGDR